MENAISHLEHELKGDETVRSIAEGLLTVFESIAALNGSVQEGGLTQYTG